MVYKVDFKIFYALIEIEYVKSVKLFGQFTLFVKAFFILYD